MTGVMVRPAGWVWKVFLLGLVEAALLYGVNRLVLHHLHQVEDSLETISDMRDPSPFRVALLAHLEKIHLSTTGHLRSQDPSLLDKVAEGERDFEKSLPEFERQNPRLLTRDAGAEILQEYQALKTSVDGVLAVSRQRAEHQSSWEQNFQQMLDLIDHRLRPLVRKDRANKEALKEGLLNIENQLRAWQQRQVQRAESTAVTRGEDAEPESQGTQFLETYERIIELPAERKNLRALRTLWKTNRTLAGETLTLNDVQKQALSRMDAARERVSATLLKRLPAMPTEELEKIKQATLQEIRLHLAWAGILVLGAIVSLALMTVAMVRLAKPRPLAAVQETKKSKPPEDPILIMDLDGKIIGWSPAAEHLYGYSSAEIVGQPITKLFSDKSELARLSKQLASGKQAHFETVHLAKSGVALPVRIEFLPLTGRSGSRNAVGLLCHRQ